MNMSFCSRYNITSIRSYCQEKAKENMGKKVSLRRRPRQERGARRVDRILQSAATVFARVGYEAATTNAIARQAGTSIGSLYQFFPNKEAILHALAARYLAELRAVHDRMLDEQAVHLPLAALYDRIIGSLADFHATHPAFMTIFVSSTASADLAAAAQQLTQECIDRVDRVMAAREPKVPATRRRLCATINVNVIKTLLPLSQSLDPEARAGLLAEIKALLMAHIRTVIKESGG
jgi:AcrR family transcriptional regulator